DHLVELLGAIGRRVRERPHESRCVVLEQLGQRSPGQVVLIQRHDRRPALLGAAHYARAVYSPERVSTRMRSPRSTNSGTWIVAPVSSVAGFVPPLDTESPRRPGSVCVTSSSTALGSCTSDGRSSMNSTSTSLLGLVQRNASCTAASAIAICSNDSLSMKCASLPSA